MATDFQDQIDAIQGRVYTLEQQSIMIARMDENVGFIRRSLEDGNKQMDKLYDRIMVLEKAIPTYDQTVSNFILAKQELEVLKRLVPIYDNTVEGFKRAKEEFKRAKEELECLKGELKEYKTVNKTKWNAISTITVIIVGILNLISLFLR